MKACVYKINRRNGWIAVEPDSNKQYYTIIDCNGLDFEVGDYIEWDGRLSIGPGTITVTKTKKVERVVFEDHNIDERNVSSRLRMDHE